MSKLLRLYELNEEKKYIEEQIKELRAEIGELPEGQQMVRDGLVLTVRPTVKFDAATAKKALTKKQFESIQKMKPDSALAKALLDPEKYAACQRVSGQTFTWKEVDD